MCLACLVIFYLEDNMIHHILGISRDMDEIAGIKRSQAESSGVKERWQSTLGTGRDLWTPQFLGVAPLQSSEPALQ